jgi:hypothetical protein
MATELVPAMDVFPIPGPVWLFHGLLVFTFILHLLFVNLTLGGTMMAAIAHLSSGGRPGDYRTVLASRLMKINTFGISLTITTAIAPLLFVQVLYQQYFYTATILISWLWLFLLVFLMIGYYATYVYKFRGVSALGSGGAGWLLVAALLFLIVAMVHVAVNLVHSQPEGWSALAANPWMVLADPAYFPRLLHFVFASLGFSGLVVAWWATRQARHGQEREINESIAAYGWKWALWSTLLIVIDGFLLLVVLPRDVLSGLMKGGAITLVPLTVSIVLGLGLLVMLARNQRPAEKPGLVAGTLAAMTLTVVIMTITRHQVRALYLEDFTSQFALISAPQWGNFLLFAVLLLAGLGTVAYMVRLVMANRTRGREAA